MVEVGRGGAVIHAVHLCGSHCGTISDTSTLDLWRSKIKFFAFHKRLSRWIGCDGCRGKMVRQAVRVSVGGWSVAPTSRIAAGQLVLHARYPDLAGVVQAGPGANGRRNGSKNEQRTAKWTTR